MVRFGKIQILSGQQVSGVGPQSDWLECCTEVYIRIFTAKTSQTALLKYLLR
jgi:hypothetical protein